MRTRPDRLSDTGSLSFGTDAVTVRLPGETAVRVGRILHLETDRAGRPIYVVLDRNLHAWHQSIDGWTTAGAVTTELRRVGER